MDKTENKRLILGIAAARHDGSACIYENYKLLAAVQLERITRIKTDGDRIPHEAIDEVLRIANLKKSDITHICLSRNRFPYEWFDFSKCNLSYRFKRWFESSIRKVVGKKHILTSTKECRRANTNDVLSIFKTDQFLLDNGFSKEASLAFYDHHYAHVLPCLFHNPEWQNGLLYSADGGGDTGFYSFRYFDGEQIIHDFGGEEWLMKESPSSSLALAYGTATIALGYKMNRHEGKLTGLAASGKPTLLDELCGKFSVQEDGQIVSSFRSHGEMQDYIFDICKGVAPENVAASFQELLHVFVPQSINRLLQKYPTKNVGLSGGLFANVRLNQVIAEECPIDRLFIYPAMSDAGLSTGGVLQFLLENDGLKEWLQHRDECRNLYLAKNFNGDIDRHFSDCEEIIKEAGDPIPLTVEALKKGDAVAIYNLGMEFGPRALGARSVLASPHDKEINNSLNLRMERSEFMPFAPYIRDIDAQEVFNLPKSFIYPAKFMTITCTVKDEWKDKIPAVVHIDNTARPQIISREDNELYYDILTAFKESTGLPVLINTSFNVHEEPIINTPEECSRALLDDRVDAIVTEKGLYRLKGQL
ncbi:MAG: carbamoyltransferase C-terminal domain-containing protein [Opitutaceae bacterium]